MSLSYYTTSLVLGISELVELAEQMGQAAKTVEVLAEMDAESGGECSVAAYRGGGVPPLSVN